LNADIVFKGTACPDEPIVCYLNCLTRAISWGCQTWWFLLIHSLC